MHLKAQIDAKRYFGYIVRRVWKQQALQIQAHAQLMQQAQKVQNHLIKQRSVLWELYGKASHVKVHLFAQERAKLDLKKRLLREVEEEARRQKKVESMRPIV